MEGLSWRDAPDGLQNATPLGDGVYLKNQDRLRLGPLSLPIHSTIYLFDDKGFSAALCRLIQTPADPTGLATAKQTARQLESWLGPPLSRPDDDLFIRGAKYRWLTRRAELTLGKAGDDAFNLLISRRDKKEPQAKKTAP